MNEALTLQNLIYFVFVYATFTPVLSHILLFLFNLNVLNFGLPGLI